MSETAAQIAQRLFGDECPECGRAFTGVGGMMRHFGKEHPDVPKPWRAHQSTHRAAREYALQRDGNTCMRCGCALETGEGEGGEAGEAHHLLPRAAGGPDAPENMVTLCSRCHDAVHSKLGRIHELRPDLLEELREFALADE
jgi:hypothetical protein